MFSTRLSPRALPVLTVATLAYWVGACGGGTDQLPPPPPPPPGLAADAGGPATETETETAKTEAPKTPAPAPNAPPVSLTLGAASPDPSAPLPTVAITSPTRNQVLAAAQTPDATVKLDVKNWPTATGSSHVHLILDNRPYKAIYDTKKPVKLSELSGGEAIGEGFHVLVAFPSRANHESVKTKGALSIVPFWVGKKVAAQDDFTKKPMLIYSRPKGEYKGELANHVLVDFYLANVKLAEGKEHVNVTVKGPGIARVLEAKVESFGAPLYLDNLQNGAYEIKTELVDGNGKLIEGPWNSTTRSITIDHDAPADVAAAHGDHAAATSTSTKTPPTPPKPVTPKPTPTTPPPAPTPTMTGNLPPMGGGTR